MRDRWDVRKISLVLLLIAITMLVCNSWLDVQTTSKDFISYTMEEAPLYGMVWPEEADPKGLMNSYLRHNGVSFWYVIKMVGTAAFVSLVALFCWLQYQSEGNGDIQRVARFGKAYGSTIFLAAVLYVLWVTIPSQTWDQSIYAMDYYLLHVQGTDLYRVPGYALLQSSTRSYFAGFSFSILGLCVLFGDYKRKDSIRRRNMIMAVLLVLGLLLVAFFLRLQLVCLAVTILFFVAMGMLLMGKK